MLILFKLLMLSVYLPWLLVFFVCVFLFFWLFICFHGDLGKLLSSVNLNSVPGMVEVSSQEWLMQELLVLHSKSLLKLLLWKYILCNYWKIYIYIFLYKTWLLAFSWRKLKKPSVILVDGGGAGFQSVRLMFGKNTNVNCGLFHQGSSSEVLHKNF